MKALKKRQLCRKSNSVHKRVLLTLTEGMQPEFGDCLDLLYKEYRLRQADLARLSGIDDSELSRLRSGETAVSVENLTAIVNGLGDGHEFNGKLVVAYLLDKLTPKLRRLVKISCEGRGGRFETIESFTNEFKAALEYLARRADDADVVTGVTAIARTRRKLDSLENRTD
jgi:transcriptional regulator with XRE-family HTH domain